MEQIKVGKYVELFYEILTVDPDLGEAQVFKFTKERPDSFVFGMEQGMLQAFMDHIEKLSPGDTFDFTLAPEEAFGERMNEYVSEIDKSIFLVDGVFDDERVKVGAIVPMLTADGMRVDGLVLSITDDKVTIDFNHQLAGETIRYKGSVLTVRDATAEELNPPHHHCGCGCDHDHHHDGCEGCNGCG